MLITITPAMLAEVGADAKAALAERFPEGMPLTPENVAVVLAHPTGREWLDWLLRSTVCPEAVRAQYKAARAPAWAQYEAATAEARAQYGAAVAEALAQFETARAPAWAQYDAALAEALAQYKAAVAEAGTQYAAARAETIRTTMLAWAAMEATDA